MENGGIRMRVGRRRCAEGGRRGSLIYLLGRKRRYRSRTLNLVYAKQSGRLTWGPFGFWATGCNACNTPSPPSSLPRIRNAQNMIIAPRNRGRGRTAEPTTRTWQPNCLAARHAAEAEQPPSRSVGRIPSSVRSQIPICVNGDGRSFCAQTSQFLEVRERC